MRPLIAFIGLSGCGKTTAARYFNDHGFTRLRFAEPLKRMLRAIGLTDAQLDGDLKEQETNLLCDRTPRHAMQTLGTEWGRNQIDQDFWVNIW